MQAGDTLRASVSNTHAKKLQIRCTWRAEMLHLVSRKGAEKLQNVFYNWNSGPPRDATFLDTGLAKKSRLYLPLGFPNLDWGYKTNGLQ